MAVIAVLGPTATGKSELAVGLAQRFDGEVVNADALQVYRGFDVGTAKPSVAERSVVPHHLFDEVDPDEHYSAGRYSRRARSVLAEIESRGRAAILVGGSGLYLRAALEGLSPLPERDPGLRLTLQTKLEEDGLEAIRADLAKVDPATHARLPAGDTQRILRALEVCLTTGTPMSEWLKKIPPATDSVQALRIGLTLPRAILYDRIESRVRRMVKCGWVAEVEGLLAQGCSADTRAFQAIGYRQLLHHLVEGASLDTAIEEIVRETRRFAKRQETWFRKTTEVEWFQAEEGALPLVVEYLVKKGFR